jgi:hypothetical protein
MSGFSVAQKRKEGRKEGNKGEREGKPIKYTGFFPPQSAYYYF